MPYTLTPEQKGLIATAIDMYNNPTDDHILKVSAVAGSSKTYTLTKIADALPHTAQLYLAYNKAIATEASEKFPSYVQCKTTHSLAYTPIVKYGLNLDGEVGKPRVVVSSFTYRDIKEKIDYDTKLLLVQYLEAFYLSRHCTLYDFCIEYNLEDDIYDILYKYFMAMVNNTIPCTHSFYLKMYHILLVTGCIHYDKPYDLLLLDEAGDLNPVTLEIFKALPARVKIMVGDPFQNIYSFNHTINGFHALRDIGVTKTLSTSFRCSTAIADTVESFCQRHLDPSFVFHGIDHADTTIRSEAIISRTNSGLIEHMISLTEAHIPFHTTRPPKEIFADMLTLMTLKEGCKILNHNLKFIQKDVDEYFKSKSLQSKYKTCLIYINALYKEEERSIKIAAQTIFNHGATDIYAAYNFAKKCDESSETFPLTLTTAHSSKGLTFDSVTLSDDFDLDDILEMPSDERQPSQVEEIRLYYVACTRSRLKLVNAKYLTK